VTVRARRFGGAWVMVGVLPLAQGSAIELRPLPDAAPRPYELRATGAARVCPL